MAASDPNEFARVLRPAMAQAAAVASALEGRVPNVPKRGESTAVKAALTIADTAAQEALLVPLAESFAAACLEAEEDTSSVAKFSGADARSRIVVDPIDGTLHFYLSALGPYAVMAGLALDCRYVAALVALPREGWLFEAVRGGGARRMRLDGSWSEPAHVADEGRGLMLSDGVPEAVAERLAARGWEVQRGCGGAVAIAPLLPGVRAGIRFAKSASISTRGRIGLLISAEAGARILDRRGDPFPPDLDGPVDSLVVAADDAIAADLIAALAG